MPIGPARAVGEALDAAIAVAFEDLVAGLARDRELIAEPRHRFPLQQAGDELHPFVHDVTLL
jgi:hypothetical protein